jgi:hypothetical protein
MGGTGVGKSYAGNFILDGRNSGRLKSSSASVGGVTKEVRIFEANALGNKSNPKVSFVDVPGFGDPTFNIEEIAEEIEKVFSSGQKIQICLIVTKSTDYRLSFQEIIALKAIKTFLSDIKPEGFYCWISHCDVSEPDEIFIEGKLDSYNQFAEIAIPRQNVILFNNSAASLKNFIGKLRSSTLPSMTINLPMLQQNAKVISSEIASLVSGV